MIASEVLEHIDDDEAALAELTRVLRPGGTLAVTIPARLLKVENVVMIPARLLVMVAAVVMMAVVVPHLRRKRK